MGNDGVNTEWERKLEQKWERESLCPIWNGNGDGNRQDQRGMAADSGSFLLTAYLMFMLLNGGSNSMTYFHTLDVYLLLPTSAPTTFTTVLPTVMDLPSSNG